MYSTEIEIQDQAYQFFKQEAPEFLQTIETGLLSLRNDFSTNNIHSIMRAAHSIKGGAASLNFEGIKSIAHRLEDIYRSLYRYEGEIDADVEGLLLQAYDCLRIPLLEQIQTGRYNEQSAIESAEPIFEVLSLYFGSVDEDAELPTAAELGVDIVQIVFDGDVQQGILRLKNVLANPEGVPVIGEIRAQVEVFSGIGELLNLSGFKAIANATIKALENHLDDPVLVGKVAVANFEAARAQVLAGDRTSGGEPSDELTALTQANPFDIRATSPLSELNDPIENQSNELIFSSDLDAFGDFGAINSIFAINQTEENHSLELLKLNDEFNELEELLEDRQDIQPDIQEDRQNTHQINNQNHENLCDLNTLNTEEFANLASFHDDLELYKFETVDSIFNNVDLDVDNLLVDPLIEQESNQIIENSLTNFNIPPRRTDLTTNIQANIGANIGANLQNVEPISKIKATENTTPYISESIKVDLSRLERLNNASSELVTQENASILQNQQLQSKIERIQKQFKSFDHLSKNLQTWLDKAQRSQVKAQDFSAVTSQLTAFNANFQTQILPSTSNLLADFDPLQMDSYSRLHSFIQEALEEIAQMDEGMRDMTVLMQQKQQTQRRKQQILKQLRYDLLWSRMLPLGDILSSLPRMVRELSNKYNKQVNLKLLGTGTLVDKSVLEKLYDPFVHLVRNAFDHGTETTQERLEQGKSVIASIEIRAYYRGNLTYIEIKDDGYGINVEKVKAKAIALELITPEQAEQASQAEIYQFLFAPNFSTAETVSELSGRGMGLSTVQEQVRNLKGSIEIKSELGQGTTFTIKLPLTLSIAKLLIFSVQDRLMAIAVDSLLGIVTVDSETILIIQGKEFFRLENRLIPLYPTSIFADGYPLPKKPLDLLNIDAFTEENQTTLLLFADGNDLFAIPIDRVLSEQELAIKPFGKAIVPPPYLYGCTVLGDGTLVPVIDSTALSSINYANFKPVSELSKLDSDIMDSRIHAAKPIQRKTLLIVDDSLTARQSLYLTLAKFGYQVIQAGDGREAIEQLSRSPMIQGVICDVEMPNMNGFEFLTICRKESRFADLPIVMLTSRSGEKHRAVAKMLGASGYLTKPYLEQDLLKTIQTFLPNQLA
ncbi:hybrid sensor histidine kinase/response regulator [Pseudanabaena sp. FACHB-1277]|uniref:histidine kinase n=1 Tax=Pseudanabaena cinerea FACHB-1277 TaxID=2949581 RepID=A0A926UUU0_9CYAN|nr:hybrid sensor histidine kinase/response regulator [Pseudanabaena cinerea]MBD2151592.1 hybrid sensor histidine kinase/response regulator [Pseudanabaena cinerea FACHB-1277]